MKKPIQWVADKSGIKYPKADLDALKNIQMPARDIAPFAPAKMPKWSMVNTPSAMPQSTPQLKGLGKQIVGQVQAGLKDGPWSSLKLPKRN